MELSTGGTECPWTVPPIGSKVRGLRAAQPWKSVGDLSPDPEGSEQLMLGSLPRTVRVKFALGSLVGLLLVAGTDFLLGLFRQFWFFYLKMADLLRKNLTEFVQLCLSWFFSPQLWSRP